MNSSNGTTRGGTKQGHEVPTKKLEFYQLAKGDIAFDFAGESDTAAREWITFITKDMINDKRWNNDVSFDKYVTKKAIKFSSKSAYGSSMAKFPSFCHDNGLERRSNSSATGFKGDDGDGPAIYEPYPSVNGPPKKVGETRISVPPSARKGLRKLP
ncbi:MAG: hypothetical protein M1828_004575 [Chrysothrix sp. TS-e1954]|nr:MAG: hypothetical protein M1828_004575 [Chrysothrix sp. TS-e1954]